MKYYAVRIGREPGIYTDWESCRLQVTGYPAASFKSFPSRAEAEAFLKGQAEDPGPEDEAKTLLEVYVDGSYNIASCEYGCGLVILAGGEETEISFKPEDQSLRDMRNVAGEIKASEAAMNYALEHGYDALVIYHDYEGIAKWCTGEWKTNKEGTKAYKAFYDGVKDRLSVRFVKVKGHSGARYNEAADRLAKNAAGVE